MSNSFQREQLCDGVHFSSVTDPKFKHNRITANLVIPLDRETVTDNAVVPFLLRKGCRSCPDFTRLNRKLYELYGASLACDVTKYGGCQSLDLSIYGVDDRFTLGGEEMVRPCAQLLTDILLDPAFADGVFPEKDVELERQQIIDVLESQINDKRFYAMSRCQSIMCEGEKIAIEKYGYIEDAHKITPASAADAYRRILRSAQIELLFVGCGHPATAKEIFRQAFSSVERAPVPVEPVHTRPRAEQVNEVTEQLDVAQSKLVLGFRTGGIGGDLKKLAAMRVMVALYGGTPNSRLFLHVREKQSLCYYCSARLNRLTGLMFVDSGVEKANKQKAYDEIMNQFRVMQRGEFTDDEITATKLLMQTSLNAVGDSLGAIDDWYMTQIMMGRACSPEEESAMIEAVTREEIVEAAGQVTLDTVYFLTGKEAE